MKRIILTVVLLSLAGIALSAPVTYKSVYNEPKKTAAQPYYAVPDDRYPNQVPIYSYPPRHPLPSQRPQVAVVTPNVQVYIAPQSQYHYQSSEEVYLPYGGTYKKTTEYLPQYPLYTAPPPPRNAVIIHQGRYDAD
ncbi:hypothetical protein [Acinetobacter populi]|uniref:Uncharacterized protein n=1 Tax=Acinetobacter populi TaxID=1582270 RepID=A0A1Z9YUU4_9GAMM|nr:hypothetical protein [Acinetobacter populi]OUY05975.1 hypothetical protein CAP51_14785 [Acinetobacter populi]